MWKFFNLYLAEGNRELKQEYYDKYSLYNDEYFNSIINNYFLFFNNNIWLRYNLDKYKILNKMHEHRLDLQEQIIINQNIIIDNQTSSINNLKAVVGKFRLVV
jgi:hypothetical protein